jgi:hypothetical protein
MLSGVDYLRHPMERFSKPGPGGILDFLDKGLGVYIFSSLWLIGGLAGVITALLRPKTCEDGLGFAAIALPPFLWAMGYWWAVIIFAISGGVYGRDSDTYGQAIRLSVVTLLIMFLSRNLQDHPEGPCARRRASATVE